MSGGIIESRQRSSEATPPNQGTRSPASVLRLRFRQFDAGVGGWGDEELELLGAAEGDGQVDLAEARQSGEISHDVVPPIGADVHQGAHGALAVLGRLDDELGVAREFREEIDPDKGRRSRDLHEVLPIDDSIRESACGLIGLVELSRCVLTSSGNVDDPGSGDAEYAALPPVELQHAIELRHRSWGEQRELVDHGPHALRELRRVRAIDPGLQLPDRFERGEDFAPIPCGIFEYVMELGRALVHIR